MSRLDSFIRRLAGAARRLELAVGLIGDLPGPVLELGLGNGRTYDHLRENITDRASSSSSARSPPIPTAFRRTRI